MHLHSCPTAPTTDTCITLMPHCLPHPPEKREKNIEETGCKIYLPTLALSKQMSQNYVGTVILGKNLPQIKLKAVSIRITCVSYLITTICNYFLE